MRTKTGFFRSESVLTFESSNAGQNAVTFLLINKDRVLELQVQGTAQAELRVLADRAFH